MDLTQSEPAVVQKKGFKKLWAKIKASVRSGSSRSQPSTTTTTTTAPASNTSASRPPQTAASGTAVTEPPTQPVLAQSSEQNTASEGSAAQPRTASTQDPQPVKAAAETPTQAASAPAQSSEPDKATEEAIAQPESVKESETAKPRDTLLLMSDVIEVDENEDDEELMQLPERNIASASPEGTLQYERAQALFQKYNMTLDPATWQVPPKSNTERVHKRKRQRVHWTCHECQSTFSRDKRCPHCSHLRCSTCVRYPPKKASDKAQQRSKPIPTPSSAPAAEVPTTGVCHQCMIEFNIGALTCENCGHKICERCLKETVIASPATAPPAARAGDAAVAS